MAKLALVWTEGEDDIPTVYNFNSPCSLVEHYPNFEPILRESLRFLVGADVEKRVDIGLAKDGSGVGGMLFRSAILQTTD